MDIFNKGPYKSQFCVKVGDAWLFQENGLAIIFTWQNEPLSKFSLSFLKTERENTGKQGKSDSQH